MPILWHQTRSVRVTILPPEVVLTRLEESLGLESLAIVIDNLSGNDGYEVEFSVRRSMDDSLGSIELAVFNLPEGLRGELEAAQVRKPDDVDEILARLGPAEGWQVFTDSMADDGSSAAAVGLPTVRIDAGYDGNVSRLFEAIGARLESERADDMTYVTTVAAVEGLDAALYAKPTIVFQEGTPTYDVMNWLRGACGIGQGNVTPETWTSLVGESIIDAPFYSSGQGGLEPLKQLMDFLPLRWWIDDRQLWICAKEGQPGGGLTFLPGVLELTEPLIARPKRLDGGFVEVQTLLWPVAIPGHVFLLSADALGVGYGITPGEAARAEVPPGYYRIESLAHEGTTSAGGDFTTTMKLKATKELAGVAELLADF